MASGKSKLNIAMGIQSDYRTTKVYAVYEKSFEKLRIESLRRFLLLMKCDN